MATYGRDIEWDFTYKWLPQQVVRTGGHATPEEALRECLEGALGSGWTPPQWWQVWRWSEPYWKWHRGDRELANLMYRKRRGS